MADNQRQTTIIGPDTHIKGEMTFESNAQILGRFEGTITSNGELNVSNGASCVAQVKANRVTIDGTVEGDVAGRERVKLNASATMKGDLVAAKLAIEEGATFIGHCTVGAEAAKQAGVASSSSASGRAQSAVEAKKQDQAQKA